MEAEPDGNGLKGEVEEIKQKQRKSIIFLISLVVKGRGKRGLLATDGRWDLGGTYNFKVGYAYIMLLADGINLPERDRLKIYQKKKKVNRAVRDF